MIDLSIIIMTRNNSRLLSECISSIISATKKISYEIIVVDNASTDGSVPMVKKDFPQVLLIQNKENMGFSKSNNLGLKKANGRYSMLLNNDTKIMDGAFDLLVDHMDKDPKAGAIGPMLLNTDMSAQRQGSILGGRSRISGKPKEVDFIMGACLMVRKEAIEQVGLMDENFVFYNDDLDWCKRIKKGGWKLVFYPNAKIVHYGGYSSGRTFNSMLFVEGFRGGLYYCKKHYIGPAYYIYRILLPIALLMLALLWTIAWPFSAGKIRMEYPIKLASLWEILKIDLSGNLKPPKTL